MSACASFRRQLLEADPPELRGEGGGPLAVHLRTCEACARAAAVLLEETARLDAFLAEAPACDVQALIDRAGATGAPGVARAKTRGRFGSPRLWIPLAAAAALVAVVLARPRHPTGPAASVAATRPTAAPLVEPAAGQDAAIIRTDDPDITVVWLFKTG